MLRQMERTDERGRPQPFSVTLTTCDEVRQTGGKLLALEHVVLSRLVPRTEPGLVAPTKRKPQAVPAPPKRRDTQTRNLFNPLTQDTLTCHIRLITRFNGQIVID